MRKERKHSTGKEKVGILRRHLLNSYRQISQSLRCPTRYRYRYLDSWREKESRAAQCFGGCFEKAVAAFFEREDAGAVLSN
jgi:hypothetical protein